MVSVVWGDGGSSERPPRRPSPGHRRLRAPLLLGAFLIVGTVILIGMAGAPIAGDDSENETLLENETPPVLHDGVKVDSTTMEVRLVSGAGIDADSVTSSEFFLSDGTLESVTVVEEGTNATVELHLVEPVDVNEIVVAVSNATAIRDVHGNRLNTDVRNTVTVRGMDGVPPDVRVVDVPSMAGNETTVAYSFDEQVADMHVVVDGPDDQHHLDRDDFVRVFGYRYAATLELDDGEYTVELVNATDTAGNRAEFGIQSTVAVTTTPPEAVIEVDRNASLGQTVVFDAGASGPTAHEFTWEFGDGHTATGERVAHEFHPGVYAVTLEVADEVGNVDRDELVINVTTGAADLRTGPDEWPSEPQLDVQFPGPGIPFDVVATVRGAVADEPVTVGMPDDERPLLTRDGWTLDTVDVTMTRNTTTGLFIGSEDADSGAFDDVENQTGNVLVGGIVARPTMTADLVSGVTFEFTVERDQLVAHEAGPDDVELHRHVDGSWNELSTDVTGGTDESYRFTADSPGLSAFAITVETDLSEADSGTEDEPRGEDETAEDGEEGEEDGPGDPDGKSDEAGEGTDEVSETDEDDGNETDEDDGNETDEDDGNETDETTEQEDEVDEDEADEDEADDENEQGETDDSTGDTNEADDPEQPGETNETDDVEEPEESDNRLFGVLPFGFVTTLFLYVGIPLLIIYSGLKSLAFYLGY